MSYYVYNGGQPFNPAATPRPYKPREPRPKPAPKPFDPTLCGTMRGWRQHRAHNQRQCAACNEASNDVQRKRRAAERGATLTNTQKVATR